LADDTIDLDGRRGVAAQKATRMRRQLAADEASLAAARARQKELDQLLFAAPATGWVEAVAKARYLLILLAQTPAAGGRGSLRTFSPTSSGCLQNR
jgi:hypothetical protein